MDAASIGIFTLGLQETRRILLNDVVYNNGGFDCESDTQIRSKYRDHVVRPDARSVISDENLLGTMEKNFSNAVLYEDAADRVKRVSKIVPDIDTLYLSIRPYAEWWSSALSFLVENTKHPVSKDIFSAVVANPRGWADIVRELISEFPQSRLIVREFSYQIDNPKRQLREVTGWRDLSIFPNYRARANSSMEKNTLEKRLRDKGRILLADAIRNGPGIGPFTFDEHRILQVRYATDLAEIDRELKKGRGRLLIGDDMKRILRSAATS